MKWKDWLENWGMTSLKIKTPFLETEWQPQDPDKKAAWELYVELLTRITTQPLADKDGDEPAALQSVYSLFPTTREIIKTNGRQCLEFTKIAIVVLNQIVRPFTAKWHKVILAGGLKEPARAAEFRNELSVLQGRLRLYTGMLSQMAGVEDLTQLEETSYPDLPNRKSVRS